MTAPVSATSSSPSQTCTVRAVRFTSAWKVCCDTVASAARIQPSVPLGRTGTCTSSHSPSSERSVIISANGFPKYVGLVMANSSCAGSPSGSTNTSR